MTQGYKLPAAILRRRLQIGIERFFNELSTYTKNKGWEIDEPIVKKNLWEHPDLKISELGIRRDHTPKAYEISLLRIPGIVGSRGGRPVIGFGHVFRFNIPRSYPHRLDKITILCKTSLFHPRIAQDKKIPVCYIVNGEIDRILSDILFNVLLRPDLVKPPALFENADWGLNIEAMKWYQDADPERVFNLLLNRWRSFYEDQQLRSAEHKQERKPKIVFLPEDS